MTAPALLNTEQALRYREANPWLVLVWEPYIYGSARKDIELPGEWTRYSRHATQHAAQVAAVLLHKHGRATRVELASAP